MLRKRIIGGSFCALFLMAAIILLGQQEHFFPAGGTEIVQEEAKTQDTTERMEEKLQLFATSAVLMDAKTGRVLYGKAEDTPMAMASTTKIMTCITILEHVEDLTEKLTVSAYAASMPKVKLYIKKGEQYPVRELLFSLMLESHNDSAVALAEYVGKQYLSEELKNKDTAEFTKEESKLAVAAFAKLMNDKAVELGCKDTWFITPNGLDATESVTLENGSVVEKEHHTTAAELARIMSYCILESPKRDVFLEITRMPSYSFVENGRSFTCTNHNFFLSMMDGALSGKTGFTNKAGYCYVGALEREDRTFIVALLACGWPNNKSYKWSDTRELMEYGLENYDYREFQPQVELKDIFVENGVVEQGTPYDTKYVSLYGENLEEPIEILVSETEEIVVRVEQEEKFTAPVSKGEEAGTVSYFLKEKTGEEILLKQQPLYISEDVSELNFEYILWYVADKYCLF